MERIIIFFIRKRLGLKKYQRFYLKNQADKTDRYYFTEHDLQKIDINGDEKLVLEKAEKWKEFFLNYEDND